MHVDGVLVRFGEIGIKSAPVRRQMEERLRTNIENALLRRRVEGHVRRLGPRLWMTGPDVAALVDVATHTFGVVSASPAIVVDSSMEAMGGAAAKAALAHDWDTFGVRPTRTGEHTYKSQDVGIRVGSAIYEAAQAAGRSPRVDLDDPDLEVHVEVRDDKAWIMTEKAPGPGGLPLGSQGKVVVLLSDTASALAAWMMMRRGCAVVPVHAGDTGSIPLELMEALTPWGLGDDVELLPVCSGTTSKTALLEAADSVARSHGALSVVTGETWDSPLTVHDFAVLRPLCGLDPDEQEHWRRVAEIPHIEGPGLFDEASAETAESLLRMRRTVS